MSPDPARSAALEELIVLMRQNRMGEEYVSAMRAPSWQAQVSDESLHLLLEKQRELARLRAENVGLFERWSARRRG